VSRFAQHTKLISAKGNAGKLVAKFIEAADLQRDNESCELMLVGKSEADEDVVFVTEVWSSESAWKEALSGKGIGSAVPDQPTPGVPRTPPG
jgi:quinol monooxygenase YgiN